MAFPFLTVRSCGTQTDNRTVFIVQEVDTPTLITVYDNKQAACDACKMLNGHATLREMYVNHTPLCVIKPRPMGKNEIHNTSLQSPVGEC